MMVVPDFRRWITWLLLGGSFSGLLSCQSSLHMEEAVASPPDSVRSSALIDGGTKQYPVAASYATSNVPTFSTPTYVTAASSSRIPPSSYETSTGECVRFYPTGSVWKALLGADGVVASSQPSRTLPVVSQVTLGPYLRWLQNQDRWTVKARIHLMSLPTSPSKLCVYVGKTGLLGNASNAQANAGSALSDNSSPADTSTATTPRPLKSIVQEFNAPNTPQVVKDDCRQDIATCIQWIIVPSQTASLAEYKSNMLACIALSEIRVSSSAPAAHQQVARGLLQDYFDALFTALSTTNHSVEEQILAGVLSQALHRAEGSLFTHQDAGIKGLLTYAGSLFTKLNEQGISGALTRGTHAYHQSILGALHEIFGHLHAASALSIHDTADVIASINALEQKAIAKAGCKPLLYDLFLVKAGLLSLSENLNQRIDWGEARHSLLGSFYLGQFMFKAVNILPDVEALENSYKHLEEFFKSITFPKKFKDLRRQYGQHITLSYHALASMKPIQLDASSATTNFREFKLCLSHYKHTTKSVGIDSNAHYICNFGITKHLEQLALSGTTEEIRRESIELLARHAQRRRRSFFWSCPKPEREDVLHVILDALARIAAHGEAPAKDLAKDALTVLQQGSAIPRRQRVRFRCVFGQWLDDESLEDKIEVAKEILPTAPDEAGLLKAAGATRRAISRKLQASLQTHYLSTYATIPSFFRDHGEGSKAMEPLRDSYKLSLVTSGAKLSSSSPRLSLKDLFRGTPTSIEGPGALSLVLIVGLPGVGKTTLSKQLAYQWAKEDLWQGEFTYVYVLPIRTLSKTLKLRSPHKIWHVPLTLPNAIIKTYYKDLLTDDASYKALHAQIAGHLDFEDTLVVLDGIDECAGGRQQKQLFATVKASPHKLLLLSRPYGMEDMRDASIRRVVHEGLDMSQMRSYVKKNVPAEHTNELLSLLVKEDQVQGIACVPINLEIVCYLFRHSSGVALDDIIASLQQGSLPTLYSALTRNVWKRYIKTRLEALSLTSARAQSIDRKRIFDVLGQLGYEALQRPEGSGRTWISQEQLDDLLASSPDVDTSKVPAMLQDTGFLLLRWLGKLRGLYEFPHLTFQEYFAGRWLSKQLISSDEQAQEEAAAFIQDPVNRYAPRYGRMFTFMAGALMEDEDNRYDHLHRLLVLSEAEAPSFECIGG